MKRIVLIFFLLLTFFPIFSNDVAIYTYYSREKELEEADEFSLSLPDLEVRLYNIYNNKDTFSSTIQDGIVNYINNIQPGLRDILSVSLKTGYSINSYNFFMDHDLSILTTGYGDISSTFSFIYSSSFSALYKINFNFTDDIDFSLSIRPKVKIALVSAEEGKFDGLSMESIKDIINRIESGDEDFLNLFFMKDLSYSPYFAFPISLVAKLNLPYDIGIKLSAIDTLDYYITKNDSFFLPPSVNLTLFWDYSWSVLDFYLSLSVVDMLSPLFEDNLSFADFISAKLSLSIFNRITLALECIKGYMNYSLALDLYAFKAEAEYGIKTYSSIKNAEREDYLTLSIILGW